MLKKIIIVAVVFTLVFMIPVTVAGAIVSDPIGFIGEIIFGEGDTDKVSNEVKNLYEEFIKSEIGIKCKEYVSDNTKDQETKYNDSHFFIPLLLTLEEKASDKNNTFESLNLSELLDKLIALRYENENDDDYISALKKDAKFKKLSDLSNTTIVMYIRYFSGSSNTSDNVEVEGNSEIGKAIANSALSKQGCKYVWGASGPNEFDCSGLVWWACKENGIKFERTTAQVLSTMGQKITKEQLQAGDIITFKTDARYVSHVGIYIGNGKMVHAPNSRSVVRIDDIFNSSYWTKVTYNYRRLC